MESRLHLPPERIARARSLAERIVAPVQEFIDAHTTVTVERATLRLAGADGADADGVPVPNLVVDQLSERLEDGAFRFWVNALVRTGEDVNGLNRRVADGLRVADLPLADPAALEAKAAELVAACTRRVRGNRALREERLARYAGRNHAPLLYVIVATGNIHEDVKQARAAAGQGADVVAVIRTTAQSLLDYVPYGATTEGFGGTYATQENFRIMRAALDEVVEREGRYVYLTNYASGLCMPEIAAMGALERLDMMLNDSMYGILFRDINMYRTFVDQKFSRMINAWAGVIINTGEDNYLTTSDAVEKAYTVLASQFLNERFALAAGLEPWQMGLGHAFEMDPSIRNGFLMELAQALMAREIFPEAPLKYMPPTKFMTGDVFRGVVQNALFNFVSQMTGQGIHLLGMLTEAIHTPFMQDRYLALENAKYVMNNMADLGAEVEFRRDGAIVKRAHAVLEETVAFLEKIEKTGLMDAIAEGLFADIRRPRDMGKGLDGLRKKSDGYWNPFEAHLHRELGLRG
ncbi:MAG: lysine 5,6-aminomutase subunit alpha [Thermoanaerobaculia bacterium]